MTPDRFVKNPLDLLVEKNMIVRVAGRYLSVSAAAPIIFHGAAFQQDMTPKEVAALAAAHPVKRPGGTPRFGAKAYRGILGKKGALSEFVSDLVGSPASAQGFGHVTKVPFVAKSEARKAMERKAAARRRRWRRRRYGGDADEGVDRCQRFADDRRALCGQG